MNTTTKKRIRVAKGWHRLRVGSKLREGDKFVNCEGRWITTSDAGRTHSGDYPNNYEFPQWSGVYIRRNRA